MTWQSLFKITSDAPDGSSAEIHRNTPERVIVATWRLLWRLGGCEVYRVPCDLPPFAQICAIHRLKFQSQPAVIGISAIPAAPEDLLMPVASKSRKSGSEPPKGNVDTGKKPLARCQRQRRRGSGIFRCIPFRRPGSARSLANSVSVGADCVANSAIAHRNSEMI
jgi:hypothetical protein